MQKKEISNFELIFASTKSTGLENKLRIIFQYLDSGDVYLIEHNVDSIMSQILDDNHLRGTTNQLMNSIIKRSSHTATLVDDVDKLNEYVWNPNNFNSIKSKIRDIKINQIIK